MLKTLRKSWTEDRWLRWLLIGGFIYAWLFSQGIPLWDDDFTSWFWKIKDRSLFSFIWEWLSPISTQPQFWGFNERPLQSIIYKIFYLVSGYESWSYFLYKSAVYAGLGGMIYLWGRRLAPQNASGKTAATLAAIFFMLTPGPMAAHILHQDLAPTAELIFLALTYVIWGEIEKTPESWSGTPDLSNREHVRWLKRWALIAVLTYLGYKSKADLKLIPAILAAYVFLLRRKQLAFFAFPIGLMVLLAVPWGPGIFTKLPPFLPGSKGSEIGWMWQPASPDRFREFLWSSMPYDFMTRLRAPTISLAGLLGPFLLIGMIVFLGWKMEAFDKVDWRTQATPVDRARTFALIWLAAILAGTSALPEINYTFRIRYGILHMVPMSILLAWVFGLFLTSFPKLPKWALYAGTVLFAVQCGVNLTRSINYRRDMGQVIVAVDQVYEKFNKSFPNEKLTLFPDFRPYDYRPDASRAFVEKDWLQSPEELPKKYAPFKTYAISWSPSLWEQLELVEQATGCRDHVLFDRLFPCPPGTGAYLMRFIGQDPLYAEAEKLRTKGQLAEARKLHEQFLAKYPGSLAGQFVVGLLSYQLKDFARSQQAYSVLERYLPNHLGIRYNLALALAEQKDYAGAIDRLKFVLGKEPKNYAALINLYYAYQKSGEKALARSTLVQMKEEFPNDGDVNRLLAQSPS